MEDKINKLRELIVESDNIVFFGGAGVSTESGIPDFRSKDGLYNQKYKYPPEQILSYRFFLQKPQEFFEFYKDKMNCLEVEPNITHYALVKLEQIGKLKCIITQNIDGLHQKAGSKNVVEIHGSIHNNYCNRCNRMFTGKYVFEAAGVPTCECGGIVKPDVVLYGECLNTDNISRAIEAIKECDLLLIGGTSLEVYPAARFLNYFKGSNSVIINKSVTSYDNKVNLVINEGLGKVFETVIKDY